MAPTIKWQRWDSASYDWFGTASTDALPSLEAELDAWIATVNANLSNAGRSVVKERGYASSTTANYAGFVISCGAAGNSAKGYLAYGTYGSTSTKKLWAGDTYADDTSQGGYGTISGGYADGSVTWITSGNEASWLVTTSVVDGQEYFTFGPSFGNNSANQEEGFTIFKCTDGEWSLVSNDSSSQCHTHYWDDDASTGWLNCSRSPGYSDQPVIQLSSFAGRYGIYANSGTQGSLVGADAPSIVYAANPDMMAASNNSTFMLTGNRRIYQDLGNGDNVYMYAGSSYGPSYLVDLRP